MSSERLFDGCFINRDMQTQCGRLTNTYVTIICISTMAKREICIKENDMTQQWIFIALCFFVDCTMLDGMKRNDWWNTFRRFWKAIAKFESNLSLFTNTTSQFDEDMH